MNRTFVFLTNNMSLTAQEIALLYKNRWQVELFFKWIKQHLKIKTFWGNSENAVRIQIYTAIITYCLVAIVAHDLKIDRSTYEILQVLGISLLDKTPVKELFTNIEYKDVKVPMFVFQLRKSIS
jgi:Na+-translocating ferredoxin:NAD+ oxidoreductase RnfE subunit